MNDPMAISEAINNSVNNYLWTRAIINWIDGGIGMTIVLLLTAMIMGSCYWYVRNCPRPSEPKEDKSR